ncbi:hypothetical protein PV10_06543 [Exophiala mesophila]|uniref:N-acetylglucosamine-induced protein 1 n=1 Tax=Exophiala mesophila TaxID=212818 RepID=A0A0D1ZDT0_EXOME|nr:uncharacterized protein PV10_06543 [Exophiala mesophila]KIV92074.1 hypothetical protein PV10_06543 [Exophiala mesophila]
MAFEWTEDELPFPLTDIDRAHLKLSDDKFEPHTWDQLKTIIAEHDLSALKRWPSDLRRYIKWSIEIREKYGSVPNYVRLVRLQWTALPSSSPSTGPQFAVKSPVPFADAADYKILVNDWPYGYDDPSIKHIIVWLKNRLESEPVRGDMTPRSRQQVNDFIQKTFVDRVKELQGHSDKVMWFRNWTALQSIPGIEHVHLFVRDVPDDVIAEWTGSDTPVSSQT